MREEIIEYLKETYKPRAILIYGSFARGDNDEYSDFDCMVIVDAKTAKHDDSIIGGVQLDCFVFTADEIESEDAETFLTAYDAQIPVDDGIGKSLQYRVRRYVREHEKMDEREKEFIVSWFRKTMKRMDKGDDEGDHRALALLWESLCDYMMLRDMFYFGSKETIGYLKKNDPAGYELFHEAVSGRTNDAIKAWAQHVISF